jgi:hypothetical protein
MYCLFFKPDEEVVADQDEDEDLLTDDDKGNDADGDKQMGNATPSPKSHRVTRGLLLPALSLLHPRADNLTGRLLCYKKHWIWLVSSYLMRLALRSWRKRIQWVGNDTTR